MSGVLVVDKPKGPTSHDVVAKLRRLLKTRQVGHCGTLDPMATGVLVVAFDEATKLVPYLTADDKEYITTIALGVETDSLDADGAETRRVPISDEVRAALSIANDSHDESVLTRAIAAEAARTEQVPPAVSAIKIDGERAHALARRGEAPDLPPRPVALRGIELLGVEVEPVPLLRLRLDVAKGYYVRALARDLAAALGTVAHLTALRRIRSGAFFADDMISLDDAPGVVEESTLSLEDAAKRALPACVLDEAGVRAAGFGQKIDLTSFRDAPPAPSTPSAWFDEAGKLIAIGELTAEGYGRVLRGMR